MNLWEVFDMIVADINDSKLFSKKNMDKERMENTIVDGMCSNENKVNEGKKKPRKKDFKDSGINYWGDFINPWTPGYDSYKPWIY